MEKNKNTVIAAISFALVGVITAAAGYFYRIQTVEIARNVIISLLGMGTILYLLAHDVQKGFLSYDNAEHRSRFLFLFLISLLCAVGFPLIPAAGWPYPVIFLTLSLFSGSFIGLVAGALLLLLTVLHGGNAGAADFFLYFVTGTVVIALFRELDEKYEVGVRTFAAQLLFFVAMSAVYVLPVNEVFSLELFLIPIINVSVTWLLMMAVFRYFSVSVMHKYSEEYRKLSFQGNPLLIELKEKDKEEYFHAIHTAHLCAKVAKNLSMDVTLLQVGGYYHRIGMLKGENTWENVEEVGRANDFPPALMNLLEEYWKKPEGTQSKEAAVLKLSDAVITVVKGMFKKDANVILNYPLLMDAIFRKRIESGTLDESLISISELNTIKKVFLEEKLYYDFLR